MKNQQLENLGVSVLTIKEMHETNGGIIFLLPIYLLQAVVVGALALSVYGNYDRGYDQAREE